MTCVGKQRAPRTTPHAVSPYQSERRERRIRGTGCRQGFVTARAGRGLGGRHVVRSSRTRRGQAPAGQHTDSCLWSLLAKEAVEDIWASCARSATEAPVSTRARERKGRQRTTETGGTQRVEPTQKTTSKKGSGAETKENGEAGNRPRGDEGFQKWKWSNCVEGQRERERKWKWLDTRPENINASRLDDS